MNIQWLTPNKKQHTSKKENLIIFCNGWGMDKEVVVSLNCTAFDVVTLSAYNTTSCPKEILSILPRYKKRYLISWSMGVLMGAVFFAEFVKKNTGFTTAIAINGTLSPLNENFGIAPETFHATYNTFNQEIRNDFYRQMCGKSYKNLCTIYPRRELRQQKEELLFFIKNYKILQAASLNFYNYAIISTKDRIMLAKNQKRFWEKYGSSNIINYSGSHYIFKDLSSWQDIINLAENYKQET